MQAEETQDLTGQTIKGYELHEMIGTGGFGAVYRAYQPLIKRDVAMKIILPDFANHPDFIRRFEFEAQLIARLEHIHIVPLYDYWRDPDGAYLIMRWLRGGSLRKILHGGPLAASTAVRVVDQVAAALGTAHRRGVVHRDIKPDNILFDEDGNAYLADFGIAKDLREAVYGNGHDQEEDEASLTGSPFYLAPEQAQSKPITPQTDLYSLGIVMYELLTGQPPFSGDQGLMAILLHHINDPVPSVRELRPDLPTKLDAVIQRATAKEPTARYDDALSLATEFRQTLIAEMPTEQMEIPRVTEEATKTDDLLVITKPLTPSTLIIVPGVETGNPYKGLQPFEEADSADFFGRDALIQQLLDRLAEADDLARFLAVIGPSGSGKSSVVKAGVIPALRQGRLPVSDTWYLVEMVPGSDPFQELETALLTVAVGAPEGLIQQLREDERGLLEAVARVLPDDESELVLTIDQFEELFTMVEDEAARAHFLNSLLVAVTTPDSRLRVIVTLRADFYDRPLLYPGFGELLRKRNEVVLPLSSEEMRQAIIGPAERAGMSVESGLVAAVIAEISEQPGALPLLQYALTEVFERREKDVLTLDAYHASGGVLGALARRAEELYRAMNAGQQEVMRQLFLRLVTIGEGTEDTRRRVTQAELMSVTENDEVLSQVLDTLGKYRLLTFDHDPQTRVPTVTVAHEALIREWTRLRDWLDDSREDIRLQRRLTASTHEWLNQDQDSSFLATGVRLQQFEILLDSGNVALTQEETKYVRASVVQREACEAEEAARLAHEAALERRSRNRLRALAGLAAVAAVITSILAALAFVSFQEAEDQRDNAEQSAEIAEEQRGIAEREAEVSKSLELVAKAQKELAIHNNDDAIELALAANEIPDPPQEAFKILEQAAFAPGTRWVFEGGHESKVYVGLFSPDGTQVLSGAQDNKVILWDVATGEIVFTLEGHEDRVYDVAISPDGTQALSASRDGTLVLWDLTTGEQIMTLTGHEGAVRAVVFSLDGKTAFSGAEDYKIIQWDLETGEQVGVFEGHEDTVRTLAISPDGKTMLSGGYDNVIILWDLETGKQIRTFKGHTNRVQGVIFSPDGTQALSGSLDRTIRRWDIETGEELQRFQGHGDAVMSVAFSSDMRLILSGSHDGTVRLWNAETGDELNRYVGHEGEVEYVVFSPDDKTILSSAEDATLRLWDVRNGAEIRRYEGHTDGVLFVDVSPDGTRAVSASFDATVRVWDMATGEQVGQFDGHEYAVGFAVFSPDGKTVLSSDDNPILLWDVETGELLLTLEGHEDWAYSVAFSPDGKTAISGGRDAKVIVWDLDTGQPIKTLAGDEYHTFWVNSVAYSPNGTTALSVDEDGYIVAWDTATWESLYRIKGHEAGINDVAYSPDGKIAATSSADNTVALWDVASGEKTRTFTGHIAVVRHVMFSPDGKYLASSSDDGTVRIWDVETGQQLRQHNNGKAVWSVAYVDNQTVLSGSEDASVRLWESSPLSLEDLRRWITENRYVAKK